jgi:hypothetical protein
LEQRYKLEGVYTMLKTPLNDKRIKFGPEAKKKVLKLHKKSMSVNQIRETLLLEDNTSISEPTIRKFIRLGAAK